MEKLSKLSLINLANIIYLCLQAAVVIVRITPSQNSHYKKLCCKRINHVVTIGTNSQHQTSRGLRI